MTERIPDIEDDRLEELMDRIQPVVKRDGQRYFIEEVDPRKTAFTWDPTPTEEAEGLTRIGEITTFHRFSHKGFFKPSIAEVLAQIDERAEEKIDEVQAFEIVEHPEDASDLNLTPEATNEGFYVATTRLYTRNTQTPK